MALLKALSFRIGAAAAGNYARAEDATQTSTNPTINTTTGTVSFTTTGPAYGYWVIDLPGGNRPDVTHCASLYLTLSALPVGGNLTLGYWTTIANSEFLGTFGVSAGGGVTLAGGTALPADTLSAGVEYRFELSSRINATGNDAAELRVYEGDSLTPVGTITSTPATGSTGIGRFHFGLETNGDTSGTPLTVAARALVIYDLVQESSISTFPLGPHGVYALRPVAAGTAGTNESNWATSAANKWTPVSGSPTFAAASAAVTTMVGNATNAAADLTLAVTDYETAGITAAEQVAAVYTYALTGNNTASAVSGTLGMPSNPTINQLTDSTQFQATVASSTATTWKRVTGTIGYLPTVVRGTQPNIRLNRAAAANTVATNMLAVLVVTLPAEAQPQEIAPDADVTTTGWSTTPLWSKLSDDSDATVITATLA